MRFHRIWITLLSVCPLLAHQPIATAAKPGGDDLLVSAVFDDHVFDATDPTGRPDDLVRSDLGGAYDAEMDDSSFQLFAGHKSKGNPGNPDRLGWLDFSEPFIVFEGQAAPESGFYPIDMRVTASFSNVVEFSDIAFTATVVIYIDTHDGTKWSITWNWGNGDDFPPTVTGIDLDQDGKSDLIYLDVSEFTVAEVGYRSQSRKGGWGVDVGEFSMPFRLMIALPATD